MAARLFRQAGLKDVVRQEFRGNGAGGNILGTLPGRTQNVIIVGAHFDHTSTGTGVIDNWTGVACMVSLAQALAKTPQQHTFVFAAFDSEEKGQAGSRWYVSQLSAPQKARITAMVNLECLGISTAKVWLTGSADALEQLAAAVAKKENAPVEFRQLHGVSADANSFMASGLAAITFDSLDPADFDLIDSPKDRIEAVRPDRLEQHYRFILKYLQALDEQTGIISPANKDRPAPKPKP
jgi:Iap family predicted aminopeptidase